MDVSIIDSAHLITQFHHSPGSFVVDSRVQHIYLLECKYSVCIMFSFELITGEMSKHYDVFLMYSNGLP